MTDTPQSITIDPQGVAYAITITDLDGGDVNVHLVRDDDTLVSFPHTISGVTEFFFETGAYGHERNAAPFIVSAKFSTVECAGPDSGTVTIFAQSWSPPTLTIELGNGAVELANLLDNTGGGGGNGFTFISTDGTFPDTAVAGDTLLVDVRNITPVYAAWENRSLGDG